MLKQFDARTDQRSQIPWLTPWATDVPPLRGLLGFERSYPLACAKATDVPPLRGLLGFDDPYPMAYAVGHQILPLLRDCASYL